MSTPSSQAAEAVFSPPEGFPEPAFFVGPSGYYTTHQLAAATGIPELHWRRIGRDPESGLGGQNVGTFWLISASQLKAWVEAGKFKKYVPRPGARKRPIDVDIADSARRESDRIARMTHQA